MAQGRERRLGTPGNGGKWKARNREVASTTVAGTEGRPIMGSFISTSGDLLRALLDREQDRAGAQLPRPVMASKKRKETLERFFVPCYHAYF